MLIDSYRAIVENVGTRGGDGLPDIDFRCTDPTLMLTSSLPTPSDPTGSQNTQKTFYLVSLSRISPTLVIKPEWVFKDQLLIPLETPDLGSDNTAFATTLYPSPQFFEFQKLMTGSDKIWNDITMREVLPITANDPTKGLVKDALPNWSPETLNDYSKPFSLLNFHPATITVMHELTHSMAMGPDNAIGM